MDPQIKLKVPLGEVARTLLPDFCLICGGAPTCLGAFILGDSGAFGGVGKTGIFFYQLCERCFGKPGIQEKIEEVFRYDHK